MAGRVTSLVEAVQLEKRYLDGPVVVRVLEALELVVERGERIAIVGESGVGKSTLLHLLGALDRPTGGQVLFEGEEIFSRSDSELATFRNRAIGFVFQFHHLLGDFTALENVMLPGLIARQPTVAVRARAMELLERVGLQHRLAHRPGQLSGGEQQRVAVARALCLRPQLLLADEPTGNLDPATAEEVQDLLLQLNTEHGSALVIATHNPKLANAMNRTLRLEGGRLHEETAWVPPPARAAWAEAHHECCGPDAGMSRVHNSERAGGAVRGRHLRGGTSARLDPRVASAAQLEPAHRPPRPTRAAIVLLAAVTLAPVTLTAQGEPSIARVAITGNLRVEEDAIRVHLRSQPGQPFDQDTLDRDIRAVYAMGFFDQVDADVSPEESHQVVITLHLKERPLVRAVKVEGADKVKREEVEAALKIRPHAILDPEKAREGLEAAKKLYVEKGYLDAKITYKTTPVGENEVDVDYTVEEQQPVRITDIEFEGNRAFSGRKLRSVMQTREKWLFSFITGAGVLNKDVLRTDMERLTAWYYDHGYVTVKVDEPRVDRRDDGLHVTVKIDEGDQFQVGDVKIEGRDIPADRSSLAEGLATTSGETFRAGALRDDVQKLTERLSEDGYAFATVEPDTQVRGDEKKVDVTFQVERGSPVTVERIEVAGNTKTRDQVIRREMRLQEQELFSASKLRKSREALQRLGFFREVNITTRRAAADDRMQVVVDVKEAQTGAFSAGAGFSSADSVLFNVRIQENNLFGRGQRLVLSGDAGSIRRNIILSFTEPYFRETPLTVGLDAFNWRLDFEDFARGGTGFGTQLTYPVTAWGYTSLWGLPLEEVRVGTDYRLEQAKISNIGLNATRSIRIEEGTSLISSVTPHISRNTLNHAFDPTAGSLQDLSLEVAGLGGERFMKAEARERWYYTFLRTKALGDFTYSLGGTVGYGFGNGGLSGNDLPLFERYFPGGINSIRGFKTRTLGPREERKDRFGRVISTTPIGGSEELVLNNEVIFPLVQGIGLKGVLFVDAGNAYSADDGFSVDETRLSAGAGVRWLSPVGPLRIEVGQPFNTKAHDRKSLILFSFGGPFQY